MDEGKSIEVWSLDEEEDGGVGQWGCEVNEGVMTEEHLRFCLKVRGLIAHALCLGLAPWLAADIPILVDYGMVKHKYGALSSSES
ncbi:hypothetical protein LguiA_004049 [Lonicera macranthoides]